MSTTWIWLLPETGPVIKGTPAQADITLCPERLTLSLGLGGPARQTVTAVGASPWAHGAAIPPQEAQSPQTGAGGRVHFAMKGLLEGGHEWSGHVSGLSPWQRWGTQRVTGTFGEQDTPATGREAQVDMSLGGQPGPPPASRTQAAAMSCSHGAPGMCLQPCAGALPGCPLRCCLAYGRRPGTCRCPGCVGRRECGLLAPLH